MKIRKVSGFTVLNSNRFNDTYEVNEFLKHLHKQGFGGEVRIHTTVNGMGAIRCNIKIDSHLLVCDLKPKKESALLFLKKSIPWTFSEIIPKQKISKKFSFSWKWPGIPYLAEYADKGI